MADKYKFSRPEKTIVLLALVIGFIFVGYGIGLLSSKTLAGILIGCGVGLILAAIALAIFEFKEFTANKNDPNIE